METRPTEREGAPWMSVSGVGILMWCAGWLVVMITYVFALVAIVDDLLNDDRLRNASRNFWIASLILLPYLAAIGYFAARGHGMLRRRSVEVAEGDTATAPPTVRALTSN